LVYTLNRSFEKVFVACATKRTQHLKNHGHLLANNENEAMWGENISRILRELHAVARLFFAKQFLQGRLIFLIRSADVLGRSDVQNASGLKNSGRAGQITLLHPRTGALREDAGGLIGRR